MEDFPIFFNSVGVRSDLLTGVADEVLHPEVEVGGGRVAVAALALELLHVGLVVAALLLVHRHPNIQHFLFQLQYTK